MQAPRGVVASRLGEGEGERVRERARGRRGECEEGKRVVEAHSEDLENAPLEAPRCRPADCPKDAPN